MKKTIKERLNLLQEKVDELEFINEYRFLFEEDKELAYLFSNDVAQTLTEANNPELLNEVISMRSVITNFFVNAKRILAELDALKSDNIFKRVILMRTPKGYKYYVLYFFGNHSTSFQPIIRSQEYEVVNIKRAIDISKQELGKFGLKVRQHISGIIRKFANKERSPEQRQQDLLTKDSGTRTMSIFQKAVPVDLSVCPVYRGIIQHKAPLTGAAAEGEGKVKAGLKYMISKNTGPVTDKEKKEFKINISMFGVKNLRHLNTLFAAKGDGFLSAINPLASYFSMQREAPFYGTKSIPRTEPSKKNTTAFAMKFNTLTTAETKPAETLDVEEFLPKCVAVDPPEADFYNTFNFLSYYYLMIFLSKNATVKFAGGQGSPAYEREVLNDRELSSLFIPYLFDSMTEKAPISYFPVLKKDLIIYYTPFTAAANNLGKKITVNVNAATANKNAKVVAAMTPCVILEIADGSSLMGSLFRKLMRGLLAVGDATSGNRMPVYGR